MTYWVLPEILKQNKDSSVIIPGRKPRKKAERDQTMLTLHIAATYLRFLTHLVSGSYAPAYGRVVGKPGRSLI